MRQYLFNNNFKQNTQRQSTTQRFIKRELQQPQQ